MKINRIKITAVVFAAMMSASVIMGCAKNEGENTSATVPQETQQVQGDNLLDEEGDNAIRFKPSDMGLLPMEKYEYPYIGMTAVLSENLLNKMDSKDVIALTDEAYTEDKKVKYAAVSWYALTEEQKNEEVDALDPEAWKAGLAKIGTLGVYNEESVAELDTLTGCTNHKEIGKSEDGKYVYYLSLVDGADADLVSELEKTNVSISPMQEIDAFMGETAFSEARVDANNVGDFKTVDITGKEYTKDIFKDYDLTLVNVFATWCGPCINEMPELEKLKNEMADKGVNVVAMVLDSVTETGEVNTETVEIAKVLRDMAKLTFPMLLPDETKMNGRLQGIESIPESFFVDKDGNIVGETYVGARRFEDWKEIVEKELAALEGKN